jgi:hypothetical protein
MIHLTVALLAFLFASISTYFVLAKRKDFMSIMWAILGSLSIVSLILFMLTIEVSHIYDLGFGVGGIERLIMLPDLIFALAFAGSLYTSKVQI